MISSALPPENITEFRRLKLYYEKHHSELQHASSKISAETPSSCNLKHLETRAKKKQLIEDRHQAIANDNRKLMEKMTTIMTENRKSDKQVKIVSMNERERRKFVERVNKENKVLAQRLEHMAPMLSGKKLEEDYKLHQKRVDTIKHKRYTMATSSLSKSTAQDDPWGSTFDADSYLSQRLSRSRSDGGRLSPDNGFSGDGDSPIKSMAEFRRHVITKRRVPNGPLPPFSGQRSGTLSEPIRFEGLSRSSAPGDGNNIRFEMTHEPSV
eukprot:gene13534-28697_t